MKSKKKRLERKRNPDEKRIERRKNTLKEK